MSRSVIVSGARTPMGRLLGSLKDFSAADLTLGLAIVLILAFAVYGFLTHYSEEFGRTVVLMILILSTIVFWALFEQSAGSMTLFADRVVDRTAGDITFTAAHTDADIAGLADAIRQRVFEPDKKYASSM